MNGQETTLWGLAELLGSWAIGGFAGAGLTVLALRTWLSERIKGSIKNEYDRDIEALKAQLKSEYDEKLETHKAQLKGQSDIEIEQLKSRLSVMAAQQQVRFSRLHEKRAEIIATVYADLNDFLITVQDYTASFEPAGMPSGDERARRATEAAIAFSGGYRHNKIFIPRETALKLDEIEREIRIALIQFRWSVDYVSRSGQGADHRKWTEIETKLTDISKVAFVELEHDFRTILGDNTQHDPTKL